MSSELPLKLPALHVVASSSRDIPTSSKTRSLEVGVLLSQDEPKSNRSLHNSPNADPTARWVKRLKMSSSDSSAQGTKSLKFAEKSFKKCITREQFGTETFLSDKGGKLSEEDEPGQPKKSKELLLAHVWIKRWLRNGSQISQRKPETVITMLETVARRQPKGAVPQHYSYGTDGEIDD